MKFILIQRVRNKATCIFILTYTIKIGSEWYIDMGQLSGPRKSSLDALLELYREYALF